MFDLKELWRAAVDFYARTKAAADRKFGRAMGKHIVAKVQRARARRLAAGKKPYVML